MTDIPATPPDGEFSSFQRWVNHATSWIGGENALCVDTKDRICRNGGDFMRARDEGAFPVRYYFGHGEQTPREQAKNARLARMALKRRFRGMC